MPVIHHLIVVKDKDNLNTIKTINFDYVVSFDLEADKCFQDKDTKVVYSFCPLLAYRSFNHDGKESEWVLKNVWVSVQ